MPGVLQHEIVRLNARKVRCVCKWELELTTDEIFDKQGPLPKDRLLDAYNAHREAGR